MRRRVPRSELGTLLNAGNGLALIRCRWCRRGGHYLPSDLAQLFGDVLIDDLEPKLRCESCGRSEFMTARMVYPGAEERLQIKLRRLAGIRMVRRVIWRDE